VSIRSYRGTLYHEILCSVCGKVLDTRGERPEHLRLPWRTSKDHHFCSEHQPDAFVLEKDGMALVLDARRIANADFGVKKGS